MKTNIFELQEKSGKIDRISSYSLDSKQALIAYICQRGGNFNYWTYPKDMDGIRESKTVKNHYYYDDIRRSVIIAAYPE